MKILEYKSHPNILLEKHIDCLLRYNRNFKNDLGLELVEDSIIWHDWGKKNSYFQKRMNLLEDGKDAVRNRDKDKHAVLSSMKYMVDLKEENKDFLMKLNMILGHHGSLRSFDLLVDVMYKYIEDIDLIESYRTIENVSSEEFRNKSMLIDDLWYEIKDSWDISDAVKIRNYYSKLIDADRLSAMRDSEYEHDDVKELNLNKEASHYLKTLGLNKNSKLDTIRRDIKINTDDIINRKKGIYSLTLPTGMGKTITSAKICEKTKGKILYVVPYLSVADQTWEVFHDIYKDRNPSNSWDFLVKHDSRLNENIYSKNPHDDSINLRDFITSWKSHITITTTVQFFNTLVSLKSGSLRKLHNTYGSTILIDEPQAIPYEKWEFLKRIVNHYADEMNWKVIYLSATPPNMLDNTINLVKNENYIYKKLGRTEIEFVGSREGYQGVRDWVNDAFEYTRNKNQILWLLNVEGLARKVFDKSIELGLHLNRKIFFISGKLPPIVRNFKIKKIKEMMEKGEKILVISTQVLEAGVDLDFDGIVRDLAPFPVLIQVAGRLNRRWNRDREKLYVMQLMEDTIYSDFEFRHTGHVLYQRDNIILEEDYYDACKEYYSLCEEMPPSEVPSIWTDQFIHLRESSFEMIESPDYQSNAFCLNVDSFVLNLEIEDRNLFYNLLKEYTGYDYMDVYSVLEKISLLENEIKKDRNIKLNHKKISNYNRYLSWFETTCNLNEVNKLNLNGNQFYTVDVPVEYLNL